MTLSICDLNEIVLSPDYQAIPFTAKDGPSGLWWQKAENVAHLGADLSIWEVANAMEVFFSTYKEATPRIEIRVKWEEDEDCIQATLRLNSGSYYPEAPEYIDGDLLKSMQEADALKALDFLYWTVQGALCDSFPSERQRLCNAFEGAFKTIEQARGPLSEVSVDTLMRIQAIVDARQLENQTPIPDARPSPRF